MATAAQLAKRYPWSALKNETPGCGPGAEKCAAVVDFIVPDSSPGMYGWRSVTVTFLTVERALQVAEQPMGVAREVMVRQFDWTKPAGHQAKTIYRRKNGGKRKAAPAQAQPLTRTERFTGSYADSFAA